MKTLLLDSAYQPIAFISERKVIRHLLNEKVEVLSHWGDADICWISGRIKRPSVLRLKYYVQRFCHGRTANRRAIFKRDQYICQFCGKAFSESELTVDHIVPKSKGGQLSWTNCVTACFPCNSRKRNRTPEQAGMALLSKPMAPTCSLLCDLPPINQQHPDWKSYLGL
jgi:5-methylcytosine-specific restriction endonuclease McrA